MTRNAMSDTGSPYYGCRVGPLPTIAVHSIRTGAHLPARGIGVYGSACGTFRRVGWPGVLNVPRLGRGVWEMRPASRDRYCLSMRPLLLAGRVVPHLEHFETVGGKPGGGVTKKTAS